MTVSLKSLREANIARQKEWDGDKRMSLLFWAVELAGETGEACDVALLAWAVELAKKSGKSANIVKKIVREQLGVKGSRATKTDLANELADVVIVADLTASRAGINLETALITKFNATSKQHGFNTKLSNRDRQFKALSDIARLPHSDAKSYVPVLIACKALDLCSECRNPLKGRISSCDTCGADIAR